MLKRLLHIIIITTLVVQLLPVNRLSRYVFDMEDEYATDITASKAMKQLAEEEYKEIHIAHTGVTISCMDISNAVFHFDETLPEPHPGVIPTPPPDITC